MRRKYLMTTVTVAIATAAISMTAFAAGWQQNAMGWWYGTNADNSQWYSNGWQWIDGNGDGVSECYYFDSNGYMAANTVTPDGYTVNENGAWVENDAVQTKTAQATSNTETSVETSSLDKMIGKWKLAEVKEGFVEDVEYIYSLDGFKNVGHWSDWQVAYMGLENIEIQKQGNEYYRTYSSGTKKQLTKFDDKTLSSSSIGGSFGTIAAVTGSTDTITIGNDKSETISYCFMDGDCLVITGTDFYFIANDDETKSGSYFLGYYTREN